MKDSDPVFGYGSSREGRAAAWKELEVGQPERGPNCPDTLEMIDLAVGLPLEPGREAELRKHLRVCQRCSSRFVAQEQAARKVRSQPQPTGPGFHLADVGSALAARWGEVRSGKPVFAGGKAAGGYEEYKTPVELRLASSGATLRLWLHWSRPSEPSAPSAPAGWHLALRIPGNPDDPQGNDPSLLERYQGCQVDLHLNNCQHELLWASQIRLYLLPGSSDLGSHPLPVEIADPHQVAEVSLSPGRKLTPPKTS